MKQHEGARVRVRREKPGQLRAILGSRDDGGDPRQAQAVKVENDLEELPRRLATGGIGPMIERRSQFLYAAQRLAKRVGGRFFARPAHFSA